MSEIKFACPHCAQHVACNSDYANQCIECPGCDKSMRVPSLSATDAAHPALRLVATTPAPRQKFRARVPALDPWTEEKWEKHVAETPDTGFGQPLPWLVGLLMLLPLLLVLVAATNGLRENSVVALGVGLGVVCSVSAAWAAVRNLRAGAVTRWVTGVFLMLGLMVMQLGVLGFAGCCAAID